MIEVNRPYLPPLDEYNCFLEGIWKRKWLTNNGPLCKNLENKLKKYLNVKNLLFVGNGTIALQIAIKALDLKGEIITTPFSYVATTSSIVWENCKPVYVDIDKETLNIDSSKIESAITKNTSAILATHVYGNPCDVVAIEKIAKKHNIKVIYDAAHAFGVKVDGKSIFEYGDISTCSTHATKLFHTIEGGFIVTKNTSLFQKMSYMINFGHDGPEKFQGLGINGKNSEFHSAMGLANLSHMDYIINNRKKITERYSFNLKDFNAKVPIWHKQSESNYAYYPLIFESETFLLKIIDILKKNKIFGRRYFYPSLGTSLPYVKQTFLKNTDEISKRVYCLPLYVDLKLKDVDNICEILSKNQNKRL